MQNLPFHSFPRLLQIENGDTPFENRVDLFTRTLVIEAPLQYILQINQTVVTDPITVENRGRVLLF